MYTCNSSLADVRKTPYADRTSNCEAHAPPLPAPLLALRPLNPGRLARRQVHLRLGDLNMVNGMYNEAADEFEKCLQHRLAMPCPVSRGVADGHVRRAQALFYASTLEGADKVGRLLPLV